MAERIFWFIFFHTFSFLVSDVCSLKLQGKTYQRMSIYFDRWQIEKTRYAQNISSNLVHNLFRKLVVSGFNRYCNSWQVMLWFSKSVSFFEPFRNVSQEMCLINSSSGCWLFLQLDLINLDLLRKTRKSLSNDWSKKKIYFETIISNLVKLIS